jgi:hypothetical protein
MISFDKRLNLPALSYFVQAKTTKGREKVYNRKEKLRSRQQIPPEIKRL